MKQYDKFEDYLTLFDVDIHAQLTDQALLPGVAGLIAYENLNLDASARGARTSLRYGSACTCARREDAPPWLNDLPSQRQYPIAYYEKAQK